MGIPATVNYSGRVRMRLGVPALALLVVTLAACKSKGGTDSPDSGATITARTDDDGVVFHASGGPSGTVYAIGKATFTWNEDLSASAYELGVPTEELPSDGSVSVTARWYDDANAQREQTIAVPFTRPASHSPADRKLVVKAGLMLPPPTYGGRGQMHPLPRAPAAATATPTFVVSFAPLCTALLDGTAVHTFENAGALWSGRYWIRPSDFTIEVKDDAAQVRAGRFPDVLQGANAHVIRLECPGLAPQEASPPVDPYVRAWTIKYTLEDPALPVRTVGPRKTLVVLHEDVEADSVPAGGIVRYYGSPGPVMDTDLVGSLGEQKLTRPACPNRPIDAHAFVITVRDRARGLVTSTTLEPKIDCAKLDGPNVETASDGKTLVVRPTDAQVDAWAKSVLR